MLQRHRESAFLLSTRAQAQAAIGGDKATSAFKDLVDHLSRVEREDETKKMQERLKTLQNIKEIRFQPIASTTSKESRLPVVSAETVRKSGRLNEQMRPAEPQRPQRARKKRHRL